jgi:hypothetical protein
MNSGIHASLFGEEEQAVSMGDALNLVRLPIEKASHCRHSAILAGIEVENGHFLEPLGNKE